MINGKRLYIIWKKRYPLILLAFFAHHVLELVSFEVGDANAFIKSIRFVFPFEEEVFLSIEKTLNEKGLQDAYKEVVSHLEALQQSSFLVPVHMANRYARINQYDKVIEQVELGFEVHDQNMPYIGSGFNNLDELFDNPRFLAIIEKLNLPIPGK